MRRGVSERFAARKRAGTPHLSEFLERLLQKDVINHVELLELHHHVLEHRDFVTRRYFDNAMRAVANAIAILVAPLGVEREIIVCWIGAHGRSAVRRNWGGVSRLLHT